MPPQVSQIDPQEAKRFLEHVRLDARVLLDVRQDFEYAEGHLPGALHIPLPELAERLGELDKSLPVLTYCRSGVRSLAAANMLAGQEFQVVMSLKGGLSAWAGPQAQGPVDLGMEALAAARTPAELLERAWGMELALEEFYTALATRATDEELVALFKRFAGFEERHRRTITEIWARYDGKKQGEASAFETRGRNSVPPGTLEGGIQARDYLGLMSDPAATGEALELAMAIEAQALDLYLRRSKTAADADLKRTLTLLAEEERAHLKVLGAFVTGRGRF